MDKYPFGNNIFRSNETHCRSTTKLEASEYARKYARSMQVAVSNFSYNLSGLRLSSGHSTDTTSLTSKHWQLNLGYSLQSYKVLSIDQWYVNETIDMRKILHI